MSAHLPSDRSFQLLEVVPGRMESSPAVARRNWPDEINARIVEEALAPDVNVSAVARRYGMSPSQLFGWRRKAIAKGQVERREGHGEDAGTSGGIIEIGIAGTMVRVGAAVSEESPVPCPASDPLGMIPSGVKVYLASQPVDFRKGPDGLVGLVRDAGADPFNGSLYVFRAKRADRIKVVWWDGTGLCLYAKRLEKAAFCWPRIGNNRVQLNHAQLLALVDGMDWKRVRSVPVSRPQSAG